MKNVPSPRRASPTVLPDHLAALRERLAETVHDAWAARRLSEGWTYGPRRDDILKEHPCLVPYEKLPESDKEYDRATALATLTAVLQLGYRILPPERDATLGS
jgi:ryanodine receptor 2